ncbi:RNA recognition motif domain-containing protein [Streptomyces sp. NPDC015345]|uniref:RNA recognition motif domain-containing protein n=1 Tax=unclassified Streptomyces TaxID=2593676 RepID=UPI0036F8E67C
MDVKLRVDNLAQETTDISLQKIFGQYGQVLHSLVMLDRDTGQSRGFGFVTMTDQREADRAIEGLDGTELDGQQITVKLTR